MRSDSLAEFIKIGPRTSIYTPEKPTEGELIILCTWLGAGRRATLKYVAMYQNIAPRAQILLIESEASVLVSSYAYQRRQIQPAVSAVCDVLTKSQQAYPDTEPKIILQTFSNGGTNTAAQLVIVLEERLRKPLPLVGLICDSGPARSSYWKLYNATMLSLPKNIFARILGAIVCHCVLILLKIWIACGNEDPFELQRRTLLDEACIRGRSDQHSEGHCRICYLYSKADRMCAWTDMADHAQQATKQQWQVEQIVFEDSAHCAHLQKHETIYVNAVRQIWEATECSLVRDLDKADSTVQVISL